MENIIGREEHEEFARRMDDEHNRINHRLKKLEDAIHQIGELTASVDRLASSVESMVKSQTKYEARLENLENRDGEKWRKVSSYIITTLIGAIVTFLLMKLGIG